MTEDDTYRRLMRSSIDTVDAEVLRMFDSAFTTFTTGSSADDYEEMLELIKSHYWTPKEYFQASRITWPNGSIDL